jgi:hypothetical protein
MASSPARAARRQSPAVLRRLLGDGVTMMRIRRTRRARLLVQNPRLLPGLAQRGGWSGDVLQGILDMGRCSVCRTISEAAVLLGCAGRHGGRGGEAGELEEVGRLGYSSL